MRPVAVRPRINSKGSDHCGAGFYFQGRQASPQAARRCVLVHVSVCYVRQKRAVPRVLGVPRVRSLGAKSKVSMLLWTVALQRRGEI